ncbi:hypothetical protein LCGC14_1143670, partial [marine sediment metagenome]
STPTSTPTPVVIPTPAPTSTPTPAPVISSPTLPDTTSDTISSWFSPGSSGVSAPTAAPAVTGTPEPSGITLPSITKGGGAIAPSTVSNLWRPSEAVDRWAAPKPKPYRIPEYRRSGSSRAGSLPYGESPSFEAPSPYGVPTVSASTLADVGSIGATALYGVSEDPVGNVAGTDYSDLIKRFSDRGAYNFKPINFLSSRAGPDADAPEGMDWVIRETPSGEETWALVPEGESSRPSARRGGDITSPAALVRSDGSSTPGGSGDPGGGGYYPSGYGGAAGGVAEEAPETLGELTWWGPDAVTPLLKGWGKWLRELVEINAESRPVPYLFDFEPEIDESAELRTVLEDLEGLLGKPGGTAATAAQPATGGTRTADELARRLQIALGAERGEGQSNQDFVISRLQGVLSEGNLTPEETERINDMISRAQAGESVGEEISNLPSQVWTPGTPAIAGTAGVPAFADFTAGGKESLSPRMRAVLRELSDRRQRGGSTLGYIEQLIDESRGEGEDARPWEELLRMAQSGEGGESALDQLLAQYSSVAEEWDDTVPQLKTPQPGVGSVSGILKRLQRMLGVETADDASQTEKWQQLINKIPGASFEAQQLMHSLTFDQSGKWMTQSSSMLPNPAFT